jgi:hypothetical protein
LIAVTGFAASVAICGATEAAAQAASSSTAAQSASASVTAQEAVGVSAEFSRKIDSKNAKVGDAVEAKTTSDTRLSDGTALPRGSRLVGRVTDVQAKFKDNPDSRVSFTFDHAVLRDGRQISIHAWMQSIAVPTVATAASGSDDMMSAPGLGGGGAAPGGGIGGPRGNTGPGSMVGNPGNAASGVSGQAGGMAGNPTSGLNPTPGNMSGSLAANTAALNGTAGASGLAPSGSVRNLSGVTFSTVSASGNASANSGTASAGSATATMVSARGKNVTLDSGTQMVLALIPQQ